MKKLTLVFVFVIVLFAAYRAEAAEGGLKGVWKWEDYYRDEADDITMGSALTLTFGADGDVKIEPLQYDMPPDVAYGNYEADGRTLRVVISKVEPFFEDEGSAFFEVGNTFVSDYVIVGDRLNTPFWGNGNATLEFRRVMAPATPPSGEIDAKLVGTWEYSTIDDVGATYLYIYSFGDDGGFSYHEREYRVTNTINGSYTASNGRAYLSLVDDMGTKRSGQTLEYSFGTDKHGEFLSIQQLLWDGALLEKMEFRRSDN